MITVVPTDRIYLCCGYTDMRNGIDGLGADATEKLDDRGDDFGVIVCQYSCQLGEFLARFCSEGSEVCCRHPS